MLILFTDIMYGIMEKSLFLVRLNMLSKTFKTFKIFLPSHCEYRFTTVCAAYYR
jgi:hypothetical protein